ncbi:Uncharacterized protein QTN25_008035 [Entamoeba marina]
MSFQTVQQQEVDTSDYDMWLALSQSQQDFEMVVDKELLKKMVSCFQNHINESCKDYFFTQLKNKMEMIDNEYSKRFHEVIDQIENIKQGLALEKEKFNELKKRCYAEMQTETKLEAELQQCQFEQKQLEEQLIRTREKIKKDYDFISSKIKATEQTAEHKQTDLTGIVEKHNQMVEEYSKLYDAYNKYRTAYEKFTSLKK